MRINNDQLSALAFQLGKILQMKGLMLATAESCTGGWVATCITEVAGSSEWFDRGFVTYSNEAKIEMLAVDAAMIKSQGAVSRITVLAMAAGALRNSRAQVSVAVSGIAGPGGGTGEKPVGTVWFAWQIAGSEGVSRKMVFEGDRHAVRHQAVAVALKGLIEICSA